jgi:hypothetical protein
MESKLEFTQSHRTYRNWNWASLTVGSQITTRTAPKTNIKKLKPELESNLNFRKKEEPKLN